jgi:hypothetical protein
VQPERDGRVRCSAWLGHTVFIKLIVNTSFADSANAIRSSRMLLAF